MSYASSLREIVGTDWVITQREHIEKYLSDETCLAVKPAPADNIIVVKPADNKEISAILKLANSEKIPVFVRGGGTGLCGGAVPTKDGILLSMERLDKIEELDKDNLMLVAQAGVTFGQMLQVVEGAGLFFPPHPGDEGAQLGGLVALNAGGSRAVKYGIIRNFVKGLEVVLPSGEIITLGGKLLKNNQGLDLLHLMINSGGILGVITKVIFRLYPKPASSGTLIVSFADRHSATDVVPVLLRSGIIPLAVEYIGHEEIEIAAHHLNLKWPAEKGNAHLIIMLSGDTEDDIYAQAERVSRICEECHSIDILIAETREEQSNILKMRSILYTAIKPNMADTLDICVPPASTGTLMDRIEEIARKYNTTIPTYGHVADGNLHGHLLHDLHKRGLVKKVKREIYQESIKLGGVITGEHGVGAIRIADLDLYPGGITWALMRSIKNIFDPNNILNPDRAIP